MLSTYPSLRSCWLPTTLAALLLTALAGCPSAAPSFDNNLVGVTSGGTQDIAQTRSAIRGGVLPDPETITVEGFLSEHDIPLKPPENAPELYASVGYAWRLPPGEPAAMVDVFVRFGTTVDVAQFTRRPQNLAVVVDRSGSMDAFASVTDYRSKLEAVQQALHTLVDQLTPLDRLTLLSFNTRVRTDLAATAGDDKDLLHQRIDRLRAGGDTNLFEALRVGFESLAGSVDADHDSRLIVFTDALPNNGPSSSGEFLDMQRAFAQQDIGFTLMGVGEDYGNDLAEDISQVRGGNAFYLSDEQRITQIFTEEFDYLVTPAANDVLLEITIPDGVGIRDVYGVPDYVPGSRGALVRIPTLFFSPREGGGAIVVRLTFAEPPAFEMDELVGKMRMAYTLADGTVRDLGMDLTLEKDLSPTGEPAFYSEPAVERAALLLDTAIVLQEAARAGSDRRYVQGSNMIREFLDTFDERSLGMSDRTDPTSRGLSDERDLLQTLLGTLNRYR